MTEPQSRRELLTLAMAAVAGAETQPTQTTDSPNRHYVNRFELSVSPRGGALRARLTATTGRVFETEVAFAEASDHFLKLVQIALDGRGRLTLETENDGRSIRAFRLEAP
jgi:hypothetical protein